MGFTEIIVEMCIRFVDLDCLADQIDCPLGIIHLECHNTKQMERISIGRLGLKNGFINPFGLSNCAATMKIASTVNLGLRVAHRGSLSENVGNGESDRSYCGMRPRPHGHRLSAVHSRARRACLGYAA